MQKPSVQVTSVNPEYIPELWDVLWPLIGPALGDDPYLDEDSLKKAMVNQEYLTLVATIDGKVSAVACLDYEDGVNRVANVRFVGGKGLMKWGRPMYDKIKEFMDYYGCTHCIAWGASDAWLRYWPEFKNTGKTLYMMEVA